MTIWAMIEVSLGSLGTNVTKIIRHKYIILCTILYYRNEIVLRRRPVFDYDNDQTLSPHLVKQPFGIPIGYASAAKRGHAHAQKSAVGVRSPSE